MVWLTQIIFWIPLVFSVIILLWLFKTELLQGGIPFEKLKKALIFLIGLNVVLIIFRLILFYWQLQNSSLGAYLLPGKGTTFFTQKVWEIFQPFFLALLLGLFFIFLTLLIKKYVERPLFEENDEWILFLTVFLVGYPNVYVLILGSLALMIIFKILQTIFQKDASQDRLPLAPFLLFASALILVLSNCSFYLKIYTFLS